MSISLVAGIFVAGLTGSDLLPAAKAQSFQQVTVGASNATLAGTVITVRGVVINGVATDALIPGGVRISNSVVNSSCGLTALGYSSTGGAVYALGTCGGGNDTDEQPPLPTPVYTSGNDSDEQPPLPTPVYTSGNDTDEQPPLPTPVYTSGNIYIGNGLQVVGGVLSGNNIQIVDGVISGSDLQITGGYVTSR